ncbi:glycine betaine/L-proline ABC transporter ATP-binding protein [Janibacter sp. GXQ6167]|uniref:quaternary amine ABC transporter ATP-binding protein n=1 Tax=Janibacter sp. GXQ6167 TaxID=3240791 RepID=UPI00352517BB
MPVITVDHVYKAFGRQASRAPARLEAGATRAELAAEGTTAAVIDASFEVEAGEIFVVMGLSGSGKSTLIRTINGLYPPTAGSVTVDGIDVTGGGKRAIRTLRRDHVSMVFQHFALFPHRTVIDNAAYGLKARGIPKDERRAKASEALELVGLKGWEDKLPGQLSGGMRQRVGLARALAADTGVLLMDEAFSALDPLIRKEMQDQLIELQASLNKTILFITHDLNEAMRLGDRIAMMLDGRIVQIGTTEEILTSPANDYVARFVADVDRSRVLTAGSVTVPPVTTLRRDQGPRAAQQLIREHQLHGLYVTGRDRHLDGWVADADVVQAIERGEETIDAILQPTASVTEDQTLSEALRPAASWNAPLPVVDAHGILTGVIPRVTLLSVLGEPEHVPPPEDPPPPDDDTTPPADGQGDLIAEETAKGGTA